MELDEYILLVTSQIDELSRRVATFEEVKAENIHLKKKVEDQEKRYTDLHKFIIKIEENSKESFDLQKRHNHYVDQLIDEVEQKFSFLNKFNQQFFDKINQHSAELFTFKAMQKIILIFAVN